jgi:hypothetical protein
MVGQSFLQANFSGAIGLFQWALPLFVFLASSSTEMMFFLWPAPEFSGASFPSLVATLSSGTGLLFTPEFSHGENSLW